MLSGAVESGKSIHTQNKLGFTSQYNHQPKTYDDRGRAGFPFHLTETRRYIMNAVQAQLCIESALLSEMLVLSFSPLRRLHVASIKSAQVADRIKHRILLYVLA